MAVTAAAGARPGACTWPAVAATAASSSASGSPAGIEVELLAERDIRERFSFTRPAALLSLVAGEVDAYRLTRG
jgi:hypothetical protein